MKTLTEKALDIIREQIDEKFGGNIKQAANYFGVGYVTLHSWVATEKRKPTMKAIEPVLEKLKITLSEPDKNALEYEYIRMVSARAGAGSSMETSGETEGYYAFRKDYLAQNAIYPTSSFMIKVTGTSMEPTLREGDVVLVDTNEPIIIQDGGIYLVTYGEECLIKHIQKTPKGLILRSENPIYTDVLIEKEEIGETFRVHGKVRWFGRTL